MILKVHLIATTCHQAPADIYVKQYIGRDQRQPETQEVGLLDEETECGQGY
jgi:hypothetical protein